MFEYLVLVAVFLLLPYCFSFVCCSVLFFVLVVYLYCCICVVLALQMELVLLSLTYNKYLFNLTELNLIWIIDWSVSNSIFPYCASALLGQGLPLSSLHDHA